MPRGIPGVERSVGVDEFGIVMLGPRLESIEEKKVSRMKNIRNQGDNEGRRRILMGYCNSLVRGTLDSSAIESLFRGVNMDI